MAQQARQRMLILDGAMGTMIQQRQLTEQDFRGERFAGHEVNVKGCNDLLCLTRPDVVTDIHRRYLAAGADIIETNTFNAQRVSMSDYRLENHCREMNLEACRLARRAADEFTAKTPHKPRFVAGSVGPTNKACSIQTGTVQPGWEAFNVNTLAAAYEEQVDALMEGGVDALLIETIFDTLNAKTAVEAARRVMQRRNKLLPIMLSFCVSGRQGVNMLGQSVEAFVREIGGDDILSVGVNCCADATEMTALLARLGAETPYLVSIYPNAGLPDGNGRYAMSADDLRRSVWPLAEGHLLNIVGGCCGTTDEHIARLAEMVEPWQDCRLSPHVPGRAEAPVNVTPQPHEHHHGEPCACCEPKAVKEEVKVADHVADDVFEAILQGKADQAAEATRKAIAAHVAPQDIINGQMIRAMGEVGQRFQDGKAFVPQLLMAGRAMKAALELLKPMLAGAASTTIGRVVIGTVKGDLHDIGKNLVASMLEGCGFEVVNIGIDVDSDAFVQAVQTNQADILCMSALLTTTMTYMKEVIAALEAAGLRDKVKVMVGGAPVTQDFADEIGADGYSDNANAAVAVAKQLLGK